MASAGVICDLCRDPIEVYATGICDHPICHTCATRMRVLCKQNYCSICRTDLPEMVFGWESRRFTSYSSSGLLVEKLNPGIKFEDRNVRRRFEALLEHQCHLCDADPCNSFASLKTHYTRNHSLFFCDLCLKHLDLFSHERRVYDRKELARHRREGDPDDRSHRGHPLCEFCDQRYFDNDELMKHLRTEHYFCHFCDYDGVTNQYYATYSDLKDHFKTSHYLCEEGECSAAQFTNAFRTEIDMKAHLASAHKENYKHKGKLKRDLQLDLEFGPQSRGLPGRGRGGRERERGEEQTRGRGRGRDDRDSPRTVGKPEQDDGAEESSARKSPAPETAFRLEDVVEDFPTLDNSKPAISSTTSSSKPKTSRDDEETFIVFSESVDPNTMKPKEGLAKVSSGLKAFRTVWTNEGGLDGEEAAFPTLGESLQPKKKAEPPKVTTTSKQQNSGWTLVDDDDDDHPWSQPQSKNAQANKKSNQIVEDPPLPTQAKKEPIGARPKKTAAAKDVDQPIEHFPSLGGKGKSKPIVPESSNLAWVPSGTTSKAVPTPGVKPSKAPAVPTSSSPAPDKSKQLSVKRANFGADDDDAFPAPNWVSVSATGSGSKSAGKSMNVPLRETSAASVASNMKLVQKVSPESSPRPQSAAAAAPNIRAERDFPSLGGSSSAGAKQKSKDSTAVGSLNDVASMFASKAKNSDKNQKAHNASEAKSNANKASRDQRWDNHKEVQKAEVEKKSDNAQKPTDGSEKRKEKADKNNNNGGGVSQKVAEKEKERNAKNKESSKDAGGKKEAASFSSADAAPLSVKAAPVVVEDNSKKAKHTGDKRDSGDKKDESSGGKRKDKSEEKKDKKDATKENSAAAKQKKPPEDPVFDFSIKKAQANAQVAASSSSEAAAVSKSKTQKETENKNIEPERSTPNVSKSGADVLEKALPKDEAAYPALQSKSRKTAVASNGSVTETIDKAAFPALQSKSKKTVVASDGSVADKKKASDVASDLMDWWDVDSHKPKQVNAEIAVVKDAVGKGAIVSLESTSDFPSFHSTIKSSQQPLSLSKASKNNQEQKHVAKSSQASPRDAKANGSLSSPSSQQLSLASLLTSMSTSADYLGGSSSSESSSTTTTTMTTTTTTVKTTTKAPPPGFQPTKSTPTVVAPTTPVVRKPPPGFETTLTNDSRENTPPLSRPQVKPPPGLATPVVSANDVSDGSWADLDAGDGWSNSGSQAGAKSKIGGTSTKADYRYTEPSDFADRNGRLLADVDATLSSSARSEFIELSSSFRSGALTAPDYFRKASALINAASGHAATIRIFAELIALLPDISMQMDLYAALQRYMPPGYWGKTGLKACPTCGQVLNASLDFMPHVAGHNISSVLKSTGNDLESNFPSLKSTIGIR